jgi:hypothetical protein
MELLLKLVILCQYNSQIHRVPAGRIVTNKQTNKCSDLMGQQKERFSRQ